MAPLWPLLIALGTALLLTIVVVSGSLLFKGTERRSRVFWCPFLKQDVSAEFREAVWDRMLIDVIRCSAFSPPEAVSCEKRCLGLARFEESHAVTRAG